MKEQRVAPAGERQAAEETRVPRRAKSAKVTPVVSRQADGVVGVVYNTNTPRRRASAARSTAGGAAPPGAGGRRSAAAVALARRMHAGLGGDRLAARPSLARRVKSMVRELPLLKRASAAGRRADRLTAADGAGLAASLMEAVAHWAGDVSDCVHGWAAAHNIKAVADEDENDKDDADADEPQAGVSSLPVVVVLAMLRVIALDVVRLKKLARWGLAGRLFGSLAVSYADMSSDVLVAFQVWRRHKLPPNAETFPLPVAPIYLQRI